MLFGGDRGGRETLTGKARSHCYLRFPAECQKLQQMQLRQVGGGRAIQIPGLRDLTSVSGFAHSDSWKGVERLGLAGSLPHSTHINLQSIHYFSSEMVSVCL